jgi:4-amino-4-deoxy-L-arabinose transferase-like glycosyltransferase
MTLGLVVRLLWLSAHSVLLDEATVAIGARDIVQNHTPMWDAMSNAPFVWMIAHMLGIAGLARDFLLRVPSALIGVASIAAVYWLARRMFADDRSSANEKIAIWGAFLLALHPFAVAFSRVLFADPFQVFFVLMGCYGFDQLATNPWRTTRRKWMLLIYLCLVWGIAFIMKYNAIVPGALWLLSGVISRRYRIIPAFAAFLAMAFGAFLTLLIWPYDESVWLLAFMGKAGSYNFVYAMDYYVDRLHLVFFGITEIMFVAAFAVAWMLRRKHEGVDQTDNNERLSDHIKSSKSILHLTIFLLLQTAMLIVLGRMFDRYLLVLVPFGCILLTALGRFVWFGIERFLSRHRWHEIIIRLAVIVAVGIFTIGAYQSYSNYFAYLRNDVDYAGLARTVLTMEHQNHDSTVTPPRAFWLIPEPIAAYYLGYTQRYSRAVLPNLDGPSAYQNFFEFSGVPYADEWKGDKVLSIRGLARKWGVVHILASPNRFIAFAKHVADSALRMERLPVVDYLDSDFVCPNDMLIMQSGLTDLQGEPILEDISSEPGPPFISTLPLGHFVVYRVYRPDGLASISDTTLDPIKAGAWLMMRK